ncbi:FluG domain protein [Aspergillus sclerotiicarbonarius CBS 121057]|uniref:FluG domain protein n=1 Tax=Aspergillus sclerotiicarbonarius (strain CBS 121057 / IBT 28362) TaxID=1448318 RepID=A0A319ED04_ASPSB|nr:FluG domain protein [Aspergillus sclerotiicarbonarius CBS 121057]
MNKAFPHRLRREMTHLVCTTLTDEYDLDLGAKAQAPVSIDDVLYSTYHLMALCTVWFPTVRCRHQHSTLRKMMCSTSARPGTLVLSSGYMRSNDALKWGDVELYMVKNPEDPTCHVLLMRVKHRLNKGRRNKGVAPVFTYTERNDNLGLCVIQDILEYAFLDEAFASEHIQRPRDIWRYTSVPEHRLSTPIHFKDSVKDTPVFRHPVRDSEGKWITDPQRALSYARAREHEIATSKAAGYKEPGSLYKYRKGAAANLRHMDEHSRNVVMGHKRSGTFAYYVQVRDDTQSAFMGTPARDALLNLSSTAGLTRDASAPQDLSLGQKEKLEQTPELMEAKRECKALRNDLIARYHQICKAKGTMAYANYQKLRNNVRSKRKKIYETAKTDSRVEFFETVGNHIIEKNYQRDPITFQPELSHAIPERKAIADLEFKNRDADAVNDAELVEDRIRSLELRLGLHLLNVPKALNKRVKWHEKSVDEVFEATLPMQSETGLECPVCLGIPNMHPQVRRYTYARKDTLQRHFAAHDISRTFRNGRLCDYPGCDTVLHSLSRYKYHQGTIHRIFL